MSNERITVEEMEEEFPNKWLFIIEPECHEGTTQLKSGIVRVESESRDDVYNASMKFKDDAAIRFTGKSDNVHQITSYRPVNLK